MLTTEQMKALRFIVGHVDEYGGVPPSFEQIARHLGLRSRSGVARIVDGLENRGFIKRVPNRARGIEVLRRPPGDAVHTPAILKAFHAALSPEALPSQVFEAALVIMMDYGQRLPHPSRIPLIDAAITQLRNVKERLP